jgi:EpsI family protein
LFILGLISLVGNLTGVLLIQELALVFVLQTLVLTLLGCEVALVLGGPLAFLFFAVPMGESLISPLQDLTALLSVKALQLSNIPVLQEGWYLATPFGRWEIAQACSGITYVIPAAVLGCFFSLIRPGRWLHRSCLVIASVILPILANSLRVAAIIILSEFGQRWPAAAVASDVVHEMWGHQIFGLLVFTAIIWLVFWFGSKWMAPSGRETAQRIVPATKVHRSSWGRSAVTAICALLLLSPAALLTRRTQAATLGSERFVQSAILPVQQPWQVLATFEGDWKPRFAGVDHEFAQTYEHAGRRVQVYIAYYAHQREGAEVVNSENNLADASKWSSISEQTRSIEVQGMTMRVRETHLRSPDGDRTVWSWYLVRGRRTANPYYAKWLQAEARLFGGPQSAAAIAISTVPQQSDSVPTQLLQRFLSNVEFSAY